MSHHDQPPRPAGDDELHPTPLPPEDAMVDEASDDSFPASDPPSYPAVSASRRAADDHTDVVPDPAPGPSAPD